MGQQTDRKKKDERRDLKKTHKKPQTSAHEKNIGDQQTHYLEATIGRSERNSVFSLSARGLNPPKKPYQPRLGQRLGLENRLAPSCWRSIGYVGYDVIPNPGHLASPPSHLDAGALTNTTA